MPRLVFLLLTAHMITSAAAADHQVRLFPDSVSLKGLGSTQGLLVESTDERGIGHDLTRQAVYRSLDDNVCVVDQRGIVSAVGDGDTRVEVVVDQIVLMIEVHVEHTASPPKRYFQLMSYQSSAATLVIRPDVTARPKVKTVSNSPSLGLTLAPTIRHWYRRAADAVFPWLHPITASC